MFECLLACEDDAIGVLLQDHKILKDRFDRFEKLHDRNEKYGVARQALQEMAIHAALEEEIFYPALRAALHDSLEDSLLYKAQEEHHVARMLMGELAVMTGSEPHYGARFMVLADIMRRHIHAEEGEILPRLKNSGLGLETLGQQILARRKSLMAEGAAVVLPENSATVDMARHDTPGDDPARRPGKNIRKLTLRKPAGRNRKPAKAAAPARKSARRPQLRIVASRSGFPMDSTRRAAKKTRS